MTRVSVAWWLLSCRFQAPWWSDALLFLAAAEFLPASCALAWSSPLLCNIREKQFLCVRLGAWPCSQCPPPYRLPVGPHEHVVARRFAFLLFLPSYPVPLFSFTHKAGDTASRPAVSRTGPLIIIDRNSTHFPACPTCRKKDLDWFWMVTPFLPKWKLGDIFIFILLMLFLIFAY